MAQDGSRLLETSNGINRESFGPVEWSLITAISLTWGSSYLWIAIGLKTFSPGVIAWLRLFLGWAILNMLRRRSVTVARKDWERIGIIVIVGNAGPPLLFALAEQTLESSVVGMFTAATPLATLLVAFALGNRSIRTVHVIAIGVGFVSVFTMSWANVVGANTGVTGVLFVLVAITGYTITRNVIGPLVDVTERLQ